MSSRMDSFMPKKNIFLGLFALLLFIFSFPERTVAQEKRALLIGNSRYDNLPSTEQVPNATGDIAKVGKILESLDFEVTLLSDVTLNEWKNALFNFSRTIGPDDTVVVWYAGHGVGIGGVNYYMPRDAPEIQQVESDEGIRIEERRLSSQSLSEDALLKAISDVNPRIAIFVLDACRNNPFQSTAIDASRGSARGITIGLPRGLDIRPRYLPNGTMVIYSADRGQLARDRLGVDDKVGLSVFTRVFVDELSRPNRGLRDVVISTRDRVVDLAKSINHDQRPAYYETVVGGDVFLNGPPLDESAALETELRALREELNGKDADISALSISLEAMGRTGDATAGQAEAILELRKEVERLRIERTGPLATEGKTLVDVRTRGALNCGVSNGLRGFSAPDEYGEWRGLDADFCRAVAAAVLKDSTLVRFIPLSEKERFVALQKGEVDLISRNSSWTATRDLTFGLRFTATTFLDGQAIMVPRGLRIKLATELDGVSICLVNGTTTELGVFNFFRHNNIAYNPVYFEYNEEAEQAYLTGRCDAFSTDRSGLYRLLYENGLEDDHTVLPELLSQENLGPYVRAGDSDWAEIVRWTIFAVIAAERYGITRANVDVELSENSNPEARILLGVDGEIYKNLNLSSDWAYQVIKQVGNYGEIYSHNFDREGNLRIERGFNRPAEAGGVLTSPAFR